MTIIDDSYMTIILPEDISERLQEFIECKIDFPFIKPDELACILYIYGKQNPISDNKEFKEAMDLAERTAVQIRSDIETYRNGPRSKMDSEFIRSKYINRGLQLAVEKKTDNRNRIFKDPVILSDCFAHHVAYHNQSYFFEVFGPFTDKHLMKDIRQVLIGRMVMLGFNRKAGESLPFHHPVIPLYIWAKEHLPEGKT